MYIGTKEANPKLMSVRVGSSSIEFGGETYQVSKKTEHPNYDTSTFDYDISILTLLNPITFSHSIKPIALPENNLKMNAGDRTLVSGWGFIAENIGKAETYLRAVSVPVIETEKCREMYKNDVPGYPSNITPRMVTLQCNFNEYFFKIDFSRFVLDSMKAKRVSCWNC